MIVLSAEGYNNLDLLILLVLGHFLGDFGLQSDKMAIEKCPGNDLTLNWRWWLFSHGAIHGLIVSIITSFPALGLLEWFFHCLIDLGKCRLRYSLFADQTLHILCKVFIVLILNLFLTN